MFLKGNLGCAAGLDDPRRFPAIPDIPVRCRRHLQADLAGLSRDIAVHAHILDQSGGGHADTRHVDVAVPWPHMLGQVARSPVCRRALRRAPLQHAVCADAAVAHERLPVTRRAVQIGPFALGYGMLELEGKPDDVSLYLLLRVSLVVNTNLKACRREIVRA